MSTIAGSRRSSAVGASQEETPQNSEVQSSASSGTTRSQRRTSITHSQRRSSVKTNTNNRRMSQNRGSVSQTPTNIDEPNVDDPPASASTAQDVPPKTEMEALPTPQRHSVSETSNKRPHESLGDVLDKAGSEAKSALPSEPSTNAESDSSLTSKPSAAVDAAAYDSIGNEPEVASAAKVKSESPEASRRASTQSTGADKDNAKVAEPARESHATPAKRKPSIPDTKSPTGANNGLTSPRASLNVGSPPAQSSKTTANSEKPDTPSADSITQKNNNPETTKVAEAASQPSNVERKSRESEPTNQPESARAQPESDVANQTTSSSGSQDALELKKTQSKETNKTDQGESKPQDVKATPKRESISTKSLEREKPDQVTAEEGKSTVEEIEKATQSDKPDTPTKVEKVEKPKKSGKSKKAEKPEEPATNEETKQVEQPEKVEKISKNESHADDGKSIKVSKDNKDSMEQPMASKATKSVESGESPAHSDIMKPTTKAETSSTGAGSTSEAVASNPNSNPTKTPTKASFSSQPESGPQASAEALRQTKVGSDEAVNRPAQITSANTGISSPSAVSARRRSISNSHQDRVVSQAPPSAIPMPLSPGPQRPAPTTPSRDTSTTTPRQEQAESPHSMSSAEASLASYYTPIPGVHTQVQPKSAHKPLLGLRPSDPLYAVAEAEAREAQIRREAQEAIRLRQLEYDRLTRVVNKSPRLRRAGDQSGLESGTDDEALSARSSQPPPAQLAPLVGDLQPSPRRIQSEEVPVTAIQAALEHRRHMRQMRREQEARENRHHQLSPRSAFNASSPTQDQTDRVPATLPPIAQMTAAMLEEKRSERLHQHEGFQQRRAAERQRERELVEAAQRAVQQRLQSQKPTHVRMEERFKNELEAERQRRAQILESRRQQIETNRFRRDVSPQLYRNSADREDGGASEGEGQDSSPEQQQQLQQPREAGRLKPYIGRSMAQVREEEALRHMERQVAQEQLRNRILRAREYAANVPLPAADIRKAEEIERARRRETEMARQAEERRRRGEEALRVARKAEYLAAEGIAPRRTPSVPMARAVAPPGASNDTANKKPVAGHSAQYRDYLKEARAQRGNRTVAHEPKPVDPEREQAVQRAKELEAEADRLDEEAARVEKQLARAIEAVNTARSDSSNNDAILAAQKEVDTLRTQSIRAKIDALKARQAAEEAMPGEEE